jgi:hypothetical protein
MPERSERLHIMVSSEELEAVDTFRFKERLPNRSAAVRELLLLGMAATDVGAKKGKSQAD